MRTLTDKIRGKIDVDLGGECRTLKFGVNAMCILEELLGDLTTANVASARGFRALVWAGLVCGGELTGKPWEVDIMATGNMIDELRKSDRNNILQAFLDAQPREKGTSKKK